MTVLAIIPARYGSTRFPGKPLAMLGDKPLIVHVVERAREAKRVDEVLVATDDKRILRAVESFGGKAVMTSPDCATGGDRIAEVAAGRPDADIIVNVQGDEPLMPADVVDRAVDVLVGDPDCAVSTAMIRIARKEDFLSPNVVKVVCDQSGQALYFSRSPIPNLSRASAEDKESMVASAVEETGESLGNKGPLHPASPPEPCPLPQERGNRGSHPTKLEGLSGSFWGFKHFGLYVYRREALLRFVKMASTPLEKMEKLEQLRFLENGMKIRVVETTLDSIGVDTPEDLEEARRIMRV